MEVNLLHRLLDPLPTRQPELFLLPVRHLPRLEDDLRIVQRSQLLDPILDILTLRIVVVGLFCKLARRLGGKELYFSLLPPQHPPKVGRTI